MARPPFIKGFDYRGPFAYSITCCMHNRARHLAAPDAAALVICELERSASQCAFDVLAYCAMPDHFHTLVQGKTRDALMRPFIRIWRQRSAVEYSRQYGQRLWQVGYFERVVRSWEDLSGVAAYIESNPVRAGLVTSVDLWPFCGGKLLRRS